MKTLRLHKIPFNHFALTNRFPLKLGRQTRTRPVGKGIRFKIAEMSHGLVFIDGPKTRKSKVPPLCALFFPVERCFPALLGYGGPSEGPPHFRPAVSVVFNNTRVLTSSHRPRGERKR